MCKMAKVANFLDVITDNKELFASGENKHHQLRDFIFNIIRKWDDLYGVDDFIKDGLFEISLNSFFLEIIQDFKK